MPASLIFGSVLETSEAKSQQAVGPSFVAVVENLIAASIKPCPVVAGLTFLAHGLIPCLTPGNRREIAESLL